MARTRLNVDQLTVTTFETTSAPRAALSNENEIDRQITIGTDPWTDPWTDPFTTSNDPTAATFCYICPVYSENPDCWM